MTIQHTKDTEDCKIYYQNKHTMSTISKTGYINNLNKVKLVIGNGFDLHCCLHSKYIDYYHKYIKKFLFINKLYNDYLKTKTINFENKLVSKLTIWDVFFELNSIKNPKTTEKLWCDIEQLLLSSFMAEVKIDPEHFDPKSMALYITSVIHWDIIKNHILKNTLATNYVDRFMVDFVKNKLNQHQYTFYQLLLYELKIFEKGFGDFIFNELYTNNGYGYLPYGPYVEMAMDTISKLCNEKNLVSIDSFNYGLIENSKIKPLMQNINGNTNAPIFGIDSIFEPEDEKFIFTKTGRRIDSDLFVDSFNEKPEFENLIIYGHSLNNADYSYFFPIFDKMKLTDSLTTNVIVFAYSVYDKSIESKIKSTLRDSIAKILYAYAVDKQLSSPKRFLDSLSTQKRIITYEIPVIDKNEYGYLDKDKEWDEIYRLSEQFSNI